MKNNYQQFIQKQSFDPFQRDQNEINDQYEEYQKDEDPLQKLQSEYQSMLSLKKNIEQTQPSKNQPQKYTTKVNNFLQNLNLALQEDNDNFDEFYKKYDDSMNYSVIKLQNKEETNVLDLSQNQTESNILYDLQPKQNNLRKKFQQQKQQQQQVQQENLKKTIQLETESTFIPFVDNENYESNYEEQNNIQNDNQQEQITYSQKFDELHEQLYNKPQNSKKEIREILEANFNPKETKNQEQLVEDIFGSNFKKQKNQTQQDFDLLKHIENIPLEENQINQNQEYQSQISDQYNQKYEQSNHSNIQNQSINQHEEQNQSQIKNQSIDNYQDHSQQDEMNSQELQEQEQNNLYRQEIIKNERQIVKKNKTFEEMLEEELRKEKNQNQQNQSPIKKREFLKKNDGISAANVRIKNPQLINQQKKKRNKSEIKGKDKIKRDSDYSQIKKSKTQLIDNTRQNSSPQKKQSHKQNSRDKSVKNQIEKRKSQMNFQNLKLETQGEESNNEFQQLEKINNIKYKIRDYIQNQENEKNNSDDDSQFLESLKNRRIEKNQYNDQEEWNEELSEQEEQEIQQKNQKKEIKSNKIAQNYFGIENEEKIINKVEFQKDQIEKKIEEQLKNKIQDLERELEQFKIKNQKLSIEKSKVEELKKQLEREKDKFENEKQILLDRFKKEQEEEILKIKKEKSIALRNIRAMANKPTRKERDEISQLQTDLNEWKEKYQLGEKKWKTVISAQKKEKEDLKNEIEKLRKQIFLFENQRISSQQDKSENIYKKEEQKPKKKQLIKRNIQKQIEKKKQRDISVSSEELYTSQKSKNDSFIAQNLDKVKIQNYQKENQELEKLKKTFIYFNNRDSLKSLKINENNYKWDNNIHYKNYLKEILKPRNIRKPQLNSKGQTEYVYEDGCIEKIFKNGAKRFEFPYGYKIVNFDNGDIKQQLPDNTIIYYYKEYQITQITLPDETETNIYRFDNQQVEFHYKDGKKEIKFPDGTEKYILPNNEEYTFFEDGTIQSMNQNGIKIIEIIDGTVRIVYSEENQKCFDKNGHEIPIEDQLILFLKILILIQ